MDFSKFKEQALQLKQKAIDVKNKAVDFSAEKISQSGLVLKNQSDLDALVGKSENKTITTKDGDEKIFVKRSILLAGDANKDFFKEFIISIPVLLTKSFSQSLAIKVLDIHNQNIDISQYEIQELPALIVFENKKVYKIIIGEDNIKKVVKSLTLDINRTIEEI
ncbi:MAG: hypothetical protein AB7E37_02080 [Candidatus Altimarinota bacterium]